MENSAVSRCEPNHCDKASSVIEKTSEENQVRENCEANLAKKADKCHKLDMLWPLEREESDEIPCQCMSLDKSSCTKLNCDNDVFKISNVSIHGNQVTPYTDCSVMEKLVSNIAIKNRDFLEQCKVPATTTRAGLTREKRLRASLNGTEKITVFQNPTNTRSGVVTSKNVRNKSETVQEMPEKATREPLLPELRDMAMVQARKRHVTASRTQSASAEPSLEEELGRGRPRSRSLEDITVGFEVNNIAKVDNAKIKRNGGRRVSFEVWLSDKDKETMQQLNAVELKRQQELDEIERRRQQRKGKSFEEWLGEKTGEGKLKKNTWMTSKCERSIQPDRRLASQQRYDKWLHEKEMQALKNEQELLEKVERKTLEMRDKYEGRRKSVM